MSDRTTKTPPVATWSRINARAPGLELYPNDAPLAFELVVVRSGAAVDFAGDRHQAEDLASQLLQLAGYDPEALRDALFVISPDVTATPDRVARLESSVSDLRQHVLSRLSNLEEEVADVGRYAEGAGSAAVVAQRSANENCTAIGKLEREVERLTSRLDPPDPDVTEEMPAEEVARVQEQVLRSRTVRSGTIDATAETVAATGRAFARVAEGAVGMAGVIDEAAPLKVARVEGRHAAAPSRKLPAFMSGDVRRVLEQWDGDKGGAREATAREMLRACRDAPEGWVLRFGPPEVEAPKQPDVVTLDVVELVDMVSAAHGYEVATAVANILEQAKGIGVLPEVQDCVRELLNPGQSPSDD